MSFIDYLAFIKHPNATLRAQAVSVLGLVEDTRALEPLQAAFPTETEQAVRLAMDWAGQRIAAAVGRGYDIFQDILERFGVKAEIDAFVQADMSEQEAELLRRVAMQSGQSDLSMGIGTSFGRVFIGYQMGGIGGAAMMAMSDYMKSKAKKDQFIDPTSGLVRRAVPQPPTDGDFRAALQVLTTNPDPNARQKALIEIGKLHNMSVLPHLVRPFLRDPDAEVRASIERVAKGIYLGALYAQLSAEGVIEREVQHQIAVFRQDMQQLQQREAAKGNQEASAEEIQEILARAQAKKKARRKKR
ncbi:MAG: hypothetical protein CUN55_00220 [Phototrophicales bacterium]|nr:MAG: hypothetical protein CUN55_00220 [Phototrophicales bacterium]